MRKEVRATFTASRSAPIGFALWLAACSCERQSPKPTEVLNARQNAASAQPWAHATTSGHDERMDAPPLPSLGNEPAPIAAILSDEVTPDRVLIAEHLGAGHVQSNFTVDVPATCRLARAELEVQFDARPDGYLRLTAPSGASMRLPYRVLTTGSPTGRWNWSDFAELRSLRGTSPNGIWNLDLQFGGGWCCGGPHPPTRGLPPSYPRAELRIYCERPQQPAANGTSFTVRVARRSPDIRVPGAAVRTLVPIHQMCTIAELTLEIGFVQHFMAFARFDLVTPDGRIAPVRGWRQQFTERRRDVRITVPTAIGLPSAGIWELRAPRASGNLLFESVAMTWTCASS